MKTNLTKFIINTFIAPHGMTDLSHSIMTNNYSNLLKIQFGTLGFATILNTVHLENINDILFLITTCIHFRDDFAVIKYKNVEIPKLLTSSSFVIFCLVIDKLPLSITIGTDLLLLFMTFIHVPNHYKNNFKHIEKDFVLNFLILFFCAFFISSIDNLHPELLYDNNVLTFIKTIVISHVIYSEKYIKNLDTF